MADEYTKLVEPPMNGEHRSWSPGGLGGSDCRNGLLGLWGVYRWARLVPCRHRFAPLLLLLVMMVTGCGAQATSESGKTTQSLQIDGRRFKLDLALTEEARIKGLGGRDNIASDGGMLFVFAEAEKQQFVMRDCVVPIDLIFLDPNGRVVRMHQMGVPDNPSNPQKTYPSTYPAQYAIELKGGTLDKLDLERGDQIQFPRRSLKQRAR